jgi:hypothetical protein
MPYYISIYDQHSTEEVESSTCPSATLSITNPAHTAVGVNPGLQDKNHAITHMCYDTAFFKILCASQSC